MKLSILPLFSLIIGSTSFGALNSVPTGLTGPDGIVDIRIFEKNSKDFITFGPDENQTAPNNWHLLGPEQGFQGINLLKTYQSLNLTHQNEVIVAVIDSGVDIEHEDLVGKIWENPGETGVDENGRDKRTNGVDDDGNGYVDDVNGWNFIGGPDGKNVKYDTFEIAREYKMVKAERANAEMARRSLSPEQESYFAEIEETYESELESAQASAASNVPTYKNIISQIKAAENVLKTRVGLTVHTRTNLMGAAQNPITEISSAAQTLLHFYHNPRFGFKIDVAFLESGIEDMTTGLQIQYGLIKDERSLVGDNPEDLSQRIYGNNDVEGPDAGHGTHVAGSIAAIQGNTDESGDFVTKAAEGIARNVKIMAIRCVPNGDERDKDVANCIRYAVDNGAHIINMSFGKSLSPNKEIVDQAIAHAADNGVLMVHAAGNSAKELDPANNFPNALAKMSDRVFENWLEIGASTASGDETIAAYFTNYDSELVDMFSPGFQIFSTTPNNEYSRKNGTSMAAPVAAGVAALVQSQSLDHLGNATATKALLIDSGRSDLANLPVKQPHGGDWNGEVVVPFSELSRSGVIIDAFEALSRISE